MTVKRRPPRDWTLLMPHVCKYCGRRFFNDVFRYIFHIRHHEMTIRPYWYNYRKKVVKIPVVKSRRRKYGGAIRLVPQRNTERQEERMKGIKSNPSDQQVQNVSQPSIPDETSQEQSRSKEKVPSPRRRYGSKIRLVLQRITVPREKRTEVINNYPSDQQVSQPSTPEETSPRQSISIVKEKLPSTKSFQCQVCSKSFEAQSNLLRHSIAEHNNDRPFVCKYCKKGFKLSYHLRDHERVHTGERPFECKYCRKKFKTTKVLRQHERVHTGEKPYTCEYCRKRFQRPGDLRIHERVHTGEKPYKCRFCDQRCSQISGQKSHERNHHSQELKELENGSKKTSNSTAETAQRRSRSVVKKKVSSTKTFQCQLCTKSFEGQMNLVRHSIAEHNNDRPFVCKICKIGFKTTYHLRDHELIHTGERAFACKFCSKRFQRLGHLRSHERVHSGKVPYKCRFCVKRFSQAGGKKCHERNHHSQELKELKKSSKKTSNSTPKIAPRRSRSIPRKKASRTNTYQCQLCSKNFTGQINLVRHSKARHKNDRPFICSCCKQGFKQYGHLRDHERVHTGEMPFSCEYCRKKFKRTSDLRKHERIHTGDKPVICKYCGKRFRWSSDLQTHERVHTGEKPYKCRLCDKCFSQEINCKSHERNHHIQELKEPECSSEKTSDSTPETVPRRSRSLVKKQVSRTKTYQCQLCPQSFKRPSNLIHHSKADHNNERPFICKHCKKGFKLSCYLRDHEQVHARERPFTCEYCKRKFKTAKVMRIHKRVHTGEKPYKCRICDKCFSQATNCKTHEQNCHSQELKEPENSSEKASNSTAETAQRQSRSMVKKKVSNTKTYQCQFCSDNFEGQINLVHHSKAVHNNDRPFICSCCKQGFKQYGHLREHERVHTGEKPLSCEYCRKMFKTTSNLRKHERFHTGDKPFTCENCQKKFKTARELHTHERVHTGEKPYKCRFCDNCFNQTSGRKSHEQSHHIQELKELEKNRKKTSNSTAETARRRGRSVVKTKVPSTKIFQCQLCTQSFKMASNLLYHSKSEHDNDRPFVCQFCKKGFKHAPHLRDHELIHTGERAFSCEYCHKKFKNTSNLQKHRRVHTREKPFTCENCRKKFKTSSQLREHERVHTGETPYKCRFCEKCFKWLSGQKSHEQNHHSQELKILVNSSEKTSNSTPETAQRQSRSIVKKKVSSTKTYQCHLCTQSFEGQINLLRHSTAEHNNDRPFVCKLCKMGFKQAIHLRDHERVHTGERHFSCEYCRKKFKTASELRQHEKVHTAEKHVTCKYCGKRFRRSADLQTHERVHTGEKPFKCRFCDKRCSQASARKSHEKIHHIKELEELEKSSKKTSNSTPETAQRPSRSIIRIRKNVSSTKNCQFQCQLCPQSFKMPSNLLHHSKAEHNNDRPFICKHCRKAFKLSCHLRDHERVHTGEKPFKCRFCDKRCSQASARKSHEKNNHIKELEELAKSSKRTSNSTPETAQRPSRSIIRVRKNVSSIETFQYQCHLCTQRFKMPSNLLRHSKVEHSNEKPFICKHCKKGFNRYSKLHDHERVHTGERPFVCKYCRKKFKTARVLQTHERLHTGENPYKCRFCDKCFSQINGQKYHERIHHIKELTELENGSKQTHDSTPETAQRRRRSIVRKKSSQTKTFQCQFCSENFEGQINLVRHSKAKHKNDRPFICSCCKKGFKQHCHLRDHERLHAG